MKFRLLLMFLLLALLICSVSSGKKKKSKGHSKKHHKSKSHSKSGSHSYEDCNNCNNCNNCGNNCNNCANNYNSGNNFQNDANFKDSNSWEEIDTSLTVPPAAWEKLFIPCCGKKAKACDSSAKFRRLDGSCNNLKNPEWGLPNSTYARLLPPAYSDGVSAPRMGTDKNHLPGPRKVRVAVFPNDQIESKQWPLTTMQWGQIITHDMSLLKEPEPRISCCTDDNKIPSKTSRYCFPVKVSPSDPTMGAAGIRCVNFTRTVTDKDVGCSYGGALARQISVVTPYLDLSNVYGNTDAISNSLRTMNGGQLKTEMRNNRVYPPIETNKGVFCRCNDANENICYKTGDARANQNIQLTILQIMYLKEHNRLAKLLKDINPQWNDERLFQEARRINIAQHQHITYYEWLPLMLGKDNLVNSKIIYPYSQDFIDDYDCSTFPDVTNEHAHAAFRYFHSMIAGSLRLMDDQRYIKSSLNISDWLDRPLILEQGNNVELLTIGMISQPSDDLDNFYPTQVTDHMFGCKKQFGSDLIATDIQRDRDHALAYYNDYRKHFGFHVADSFDDYSDLINSEKVSLLKTLYKCYQDVDLYVGGSLEASVHGAEVGPTFYNILIEQFTRTRKSDRFWFENKSSGLTSAQLAEIRKSSVSRFFCDNGDGIKRVQKDGFLLVSSQNPLTYCNNLPFVDLSKWKE